MAWRNHPKVDRLTWCHTPHLKVTMKLFIKASIWRNLLFVGWLLCKRLNEKISHPTLLDSTLLSISISPFVPNRHWKLWSWDPLSPKVSFLTSSADSRNQRQICNWRQYSVDSLYTHSWLVDFGIQKYVYSLCWVLFRGYFIDRLTITHIPTVKRRQLKHGDLKHLSRVLP